MLYDKCFIHWAISPGMNVSLFGKNGCSQVWGELVLYALASVAESKDIWDRRGPTEMEEAIWHPGRCGHKSRNNDSRQQQKVPYTPSPKASRVYANLLALQFLNSGSRFWRNKLNATLTHPIWGTKGLLLCKGYIQDSLTVCAQSLGYADTIFLCAPQLCHTAPKAPCPSTAPVLMSPWHHDFWALETLLSDITVTQTEVKTAEVRTKIATSEKRWVAYTYTYYTHTHTIHIHIPYRGGQITNC